MTDILVTGHRSPDTDSIASSLAFTHLLKEEGKDAKACCLGDINDETAFALDYFSLEAPTRIDHVDKGQRISLVDHNEFPQSVDGIEEASIYSVVDHHKIGNFQTSSPLYYRAEPIGCTCSILTKIFKEKGIAIPEKLAGIMLSAIISDTLLFKSPTSTKEDEEMAKHLAELSGTDIESYGLKMLKAGTNVDKKTGLDIAEGDAKTYEFGDHKIRLGQVNVVELTDVLARKDEVRKTMEEVSAKDGYTGFALIVTDILESNSVLLVVGDDKDLIASSFDKDLVDDQLDLPGVVSRKKQVLPPISDNFSKLD